MFFVLTTVGCGDDKPVYYEGRYVPHQASGIPAAPQTASSSDASGTPDAMSSVPDPLTSTPDPLTQGSPGLDDSDPKTQAGANLFYSYWLGGRVADARLIVLVNNIQVGVYQAAFVKEISKNLRPGINTVTFTYQPNTTNALVDVNIVPGQVDPPLPAVAVFRSSTLTSNASLKPITKTLTFVTH